MAAKTPAKKSSKSPRAAARPPAAKPGKSAKKAAPKAVKKVAPKRAPAKRAAAPKAVKTVQSGKTAKTARPAKAAKAGSAKSVKAAKVTKPVVSGKVAKSPKPPKVAASARPAAVPKPKGKVAAPPVRPAAPPAPRVPVPRKTTSGSGARQREPNATVRPTSPPEPPRFIDTEAFLVLLSQKREELLAMYRNDLRLGQEASDGPTEDIVDRANNSYTRELSFSISDVERTRVLQIDAALGRLDKGTFGRCGHCSREIPLLRLEALPWAHLCVECQELLEKGLLADV